MMFFSTLFDSNYISKGLALYLSIEKYTVDFTLYVMAMDRKCQQMLMELGLKHIIVDCIEDIDDPNLAKAKNNRSRAEYCWTCGPYITDYILHKYELPDIAYLDSDLMFFSSPQVIFDELDQKKASVGLAPHFINNNLFGKYCVQFVYFKNDNDGRQCLRWWRDECLKWCYSKIEDEKYGDQKYLESFSKKFEGVVDIENRGVGVANWNMEHYKYDFSNNVLFYNDQAYPIVFFHYNGLVVKNYGEKLVLVKSKYFTPIVMSGFILPYAELLKEVYEDYLRIYIDDLEIRPQSHIKNFFNCIWVNIRYFSVIDRLEIFYMKKKYAVRKSPYSERT